MATTSAYAAAAGGEAAAWPCRGTVLRPRPPPPRIAFLCRTPARGASISMPPGLHRAAPAAAAEGRTGTGLGKEEEEEEPAWVELEAIGSEEQLDRALAAAQKRGAPIVLLWPLGSSLRRCSPGIGRNVLLQHPSRKDHFEQCSKSTPPVTYNRTASWCRKCIYLKPKLEKLAAEYYPRILFYCIDVNAVPQKLVNRAGVTKMPSIQTWSDLQKRGEVIGGHKSWLVIDDVRKMIEQEE